MPGENPGWVASGQVTYSGRLDRALASEAGVRGFESHPLYYPPMRKASVVGGWALLVGSLAGWPLSAFFWAKDEPQFVLGLSWFAITLTALDFLKTSMVHEEQEEQEEEQTGR